MKKIIYYICLVLIILPLNVRAEKFPARKPGLWEITVSMSKHPAGNKVQHCIDAATDEQMMQMSENMSKNMNCSKKELRKEGENYITDSDCTMAGSHMISQGVFSGDFNSSYKGEINTKYDPPMMGMSENKTTITSNWVGPCLPDQKPGDIVMSNGFKMNINSMGAMGKMPGR